MCGLICKASLRLVTNDLCNIYNCKAFLQYVFFYDDRQDRPDEWHSTSFTKERIFTSVISNVCCHITITNEIFHKFHKLLYGFSSVCFYVVNKRTFQKMTSITTVRLVASMYFYVSSKTIFASEWFITIFIRVVFLQYVLIYVEHNSPSQVINSHKFHNSNAFL